MSLHNASLQSPMPVQALFDEGFALHQQGQLEQAKTYYQQLLQSNAQHLNALHMMGVAEAQSGRVQHALTYFTRALAINPQSASLLANYGNALNDSQRWQEAVTVLTQALQIDGQMAHAHFALGVAYYQQQEYALAQSCFHAALDIKSDYGEARSYLILTTSQLGQEQQAQTYIQQTIDMTGDAAQSYLQFAHSAQAAKTLPMALQFVEQALALQADNAEALALKGLILMDMNQPQSAITYLEQALAIAPDDINCLTNLATNYQALQQLDLAIRYFEQALALEPNHAEIQFNLALAVLLSGDLARGWQLYESRRYLARNPQPIFEQPIWLGDFPLQGKTILVYTEQGLGDTIQFCRFIPQLAALGAKVIFAVPQSMLRLMSQVEGVMVLATEGQAVPKFDCHCPLMSLALALNTQLDNIPRSPAYLQSYRREKKRWLDELGVKTRCRVGLVWSGREAHGNDINRSIPLAELLPYLPEQADYICLQNHIRPSDQASLESSNILNVSDSLSDFAETAALCDCMDMVVAVDTSVAHLAGALGRPTCLCLPFNPDYRWLLARSDSPWYPSITLYRQSQFADWSDTLIQVQQAILQCIASTA